VFGTFVVWAIGGTVHVIPKLAGRPIWSFRLGNWSFWLITCGISLMGLDLTLAGLQQGYMLMAGAEWLDTLVSIRPYWLVRTVAGISMDLGMTLLVYNLMRTLIAAERPAVQAEPAVAVRPVPGAA
jgi:cytochrome c oxidase cbb3-type subunit 1